MDVGTIRLVLRARCLPRWDPTHASPTWVWDTTCRDAPSLFWAWTVASMGLVPGQPLLCRPETTVRSQLCRSVSQPLDRKRSWPGVSYLGRRRLSVGGRALLILEGIALAQLMQRCF